MIGYRRTFLYEMDLEGHHYYSRFCMYQETPCSYARCYSFYLGVDNSKTNGKYYNPLATQPILVEATREKLTELSDTRVLSQRALYADVSEMSLPSITRDLTAVIINTDVWVQAYNE